MTALLSEPVGPDRMSPEDLPELPAWRYRSCRDKNDPALFFPRDGEYWGAAQRRLLRTARYFCQACPLRPACREAGETVGYGLWGGTAFHKDGNGRVSATELI